MVTERLYQGNDDPRRGADRRRCERERRRGDYGTALEFQQRFEEAQPGPTAKLLRADIYRAQGILHQAIPLYQQVRRDDPLSLHATGALASCLAQMGLIDEASMMFREVLRMDPDSAYATDYLERMGQNQKPN